MAMFKGLSTLDLLREEPRVLCGILSAELARTNEALEGLSEELKVAQKRRVVLEDRVAELQKKLEEE